MKILLINGSPRKGETLKKLEILSSIFEFGGYSCEILNIGDYNIQFCKGCYQCFLKGEDQCKLEDDVSLLWSKVEDCDGLVIASPVYALGVSGTLKNFVDRIAHHAHRPTIYNKPAAIISTTAGMGINDVIKQLKWIELLGFNVVAKKGFMKYPNKDDTEEIESAQYLNLISVAEKMDNSIKRQIPNPSLIRVIQFNALKINAMIAPDVYRADYHFYKDREFFVETKVGVVKRILGKMFYNIGTWNLKTKILFDNGIVNS